MPSQALPAPTYLKDYQPPAYRTEETELAFDIRDGATKVYSRLRIQRTADAPADAPLVLDGKELELLAVRLDGAALGGNEYQVDDESLTLHAPPAAFELEIETRIKPEDNSSLLGLYRSRTLYCTQCEAQGFRKITYYQDRPDVLAKFTTTITADAERFPVLLSNGNLVADDEDAGRRTVTWRDPFPKPSYLFALVAGDLACMTDHFTTLSGRRVELRIYSEPHNIGQCDYAMGAVKRAMRWDEETFGREYDLDIFMIVAVEDFNAGAMENKGLNIFNTACVLASPDTATDAAYERVEAVIAHEYFHNWSGNRVTCRDWFQLSLKEGFTVFRDAEFTSDMHSRTVKRIEDASFLRALQFAEDSGPMAHSVRPDSYIEISNFYTHTVYEKGAEVVGMAQRLVGRDGFRKGCDLYFDRHDGQAVTTEDFVAALEDANGVDLRHFRRWYAQAGTPVLSVDTEWRDGTFRIRIKQHCPATPGQPEKAPFHIPALVGLLGADGRELPLSEGRITSDDAAIEVRGASLLAHLREPMTTLEVNGLAEPPAVSFLRGFSAPVRVNYPRSPQALAFLARHDSDGFARWDAMQSLLLDELDRMGGGAEVSEEVLNLFRALIGDALKADDAETGSMLREMLRLPSEAYVFEQVEPIDVEAIIAARDRLLETLAKELADGWRQLYERHAPKGPYRPDALGMARRGLNNLALGYLAHSGANDPNGLLKDHLDAADNLTDRLAALREIADRADFPDRAQVLDDFHRRWQHESLVVNQWFGIQASARGADVAAVRKLEAHPGFDPSNPNKLRSLYGAFTRQNSRNFHVADGAGYDFLAEVIAGLDARNPQMAARLLTPLTQWRKFDTARQRLMRAGLERLKAKEGLSKDVFEVVTKSLIDEEPSAPPDLDEPADREEPAED
ncbi:MAG: aminopeptidase N [Gammaproteobacteria bacterium]|nr:aminopeptidase N [Gammaproteobacteria bacterium]